MAQVVERDDAVAAAARKAQAIAEHGTLSAAIRFLAVTMTRGQVSKHLGIRYQHVRNVLITPVKNPKK